MQSNAATISAGADSGAAAAAPSTTAANTLFKKAGKGIYKNVGKGAAAFGSLFKAAEKPQPPAAMEMAEWRPASASSAAHRKSASGSSVMSGCTDAASSIDQTI